MSSLVADAVKSTISTFQQPSYYNDPIAQADSSNWAPEPYQSPAPQSFLGGVADWVGNAVQTVAQPYAQPSYDEPANGFQPAVPYDYGATVQQDQSNWGFDPAWNARPATAANVELYETPTPGFDWGNVLGAQVRAAEMPQIVQQDESNWDLSGYATPYEQWMQPVIQEDQANWAPEYQNPYDVNPNTGLQNFAPGSGRGVGAGLSWATQPFDAIAETASDFIPRYLEFGGVADQYRFLEENTPLGRVLPDLPSIQDAERGTWENVGAAWDARSPSSFIGGQAEDFRERPFAEQFAAGALFDPTNFLPIGVALDVATGGRRIAGAVDNIGRAGEGAVDLAGRAGRFLSDEQGSIGPFRRADDAVPPPIGGVEPPQSVTRPVLEEAPLGTAGAERAVASKAATTAEPTRVGNALGSIPGVRQIAGAVNPSVNQERGPLVAFKAKAAVTADLETQFNATRQPLLQKVQQAFSTPPAYIGPEPNPIKGTLLDIAENPGDYILSPQQRAVLDEIAARDTANVNLVRGEYGADVGLYTPQNEGAVYMPHVNANEKDLIRLQRTEENLGAAGIAKERVWDTARARALKDPDFIPETDPAKLLAIHDRGLATMAGKNTFSLGVGGKTKAEVIDEVYPGLRERKEALAAKVASLRGRAETALRQQRTEARVTSELSRQIEHANSRMDLLERKAADIDPNLPQAANLTARADRLTTEKLGRPSGSEPVRIKMPVSETAKAEARGLNKAVDVVSSVPNPALSQITGELRGLYNVAYRLTTRAADATTVRGETAGIRRASLLRELAAAEDELAEMIKRYNTANVSPDYVLNRGVFRYVSPEESRTIDELLRVSNGVFDKPLAVADTVRATVLGSDLSPLTIQGSMNVFRAPIQSAKAIVDMVRHGEIGIERLARTEPEMVSRFTQARMRAFGKVTEEFSQRESLIARLPFLGGKLAKAEDKMFSIVQRIEYEAWKKGYQQLKAWNPNMSDDVAAYEAANIISKTVPGLSTADRGVSQARGAAERGVVTSTSFLMSPALVLKDATSGLAKLVKSGGKWESLRGREQIALMQSMQISSSIGALSLASAAMTAEDRGLTVEEAIRRALDVDRREFMALHLPGGRTIPLGGPYRSFIKGVSPTYRDGEWGPPNLARFGYSKIAPLPRTGVDLLRNKNWRGDSIRKGDSLYEDILLTLEYAASNTLLPLTAGGGAEEARRQYNEGQFDPGNIGNAMMEQAAGATVSTPSQWQEWDTRVRKEFGESWFGMDSGKQDEVVARLGEPPSYTAPEIPVETKVDIGFENLKRANTQAEEALARELARGIEGRDKLDAVKEFKASRAAAWDVAMGGDAEAWLKEHKDEPETLREGYAEMYYAVDMPLDPDGNPDFDAFYEERDKVLAKAKRAGVDTEYITGRGIGTFRGEQFEDPAVAEAVDEYEQFQAAVRESGYWDLRETAWSQVSGLPGVNPGESYDDFRERLIKITKEGLIASGYPPETAWQEAAERSSSVKALTSFNDDVYKPHFLYPWIAENPQVAFDLQKWGYYNPDAEMEALLQSYWEQGIVK